ncbi:MAG: hypothetical protein RLZZ385_185 [Pseudomonadota bacterium]|jgi:AcrR family transcriptional regulator
MVMKHSKQWPRQISMEAFRRAWPLEGEALWVTVFETHREKMQIKNVNIAVANLEKIFTATFKLANSKGFQAMSLRDLSRETGISMGGIYAYIGSKEELASVIESVLRLHIERVIGGLASEELDAVQRLKAIIYGDLYLSEILNPWYYFCFMEVKGLPREQQETAMQLELQFDQMLMDTFRLGLSTGVFRGDRFELLASNTTHMLQQWYLKRWKFRRMKVSLEDYAGFVLANVLLSLGCDADHALPAAAWNRLSLG